MYVCSHLYRRLGEVDWDNSIFQVKQRAVIKERHSVTGVSFWPKVGQTGSKWQIRDYGYNPDRRAKIYWNLILKSPGFVPFGANLIHVGSKSAIPEQSSTVRKVGLAPKWVRLDPNGTIRGFIRSDFSAFGAPAPNALKSDLKKPCICPIWGQSDSLWSQTYSWRSMTT